MTSEEIEATTARVIAIARQIAANSEDGLATAAAFDYDVKVHGLGGPHAPIGSALYQVANEHLPEVEPGRDNHLDDRDANAARLRETLQPALDRYVNKCRNRQFTGWSKSSRGPIRYA